MQIRKPLVALAALLFLFTAHAQAADLGDLKLLPADGDIVVQVDVKALVGTALVTDLLKQAKMNPQTAKSFDEMKSQFGVDPEKDIERVTILFPAKSTTGQALMVVNTTTKYETVLAGLQAEQKKLGKKGMTEKKHAGTTYHVADGVGVARVGQRMVMGDEALLLKALDGKGKSGLSASKALTSLANTAAKTGGQIWFAAVLPDEVKAKMATQNPEMKDIQTVQGGLDLTDGLKLRVNMGTAKGAAGAMVTQINQQLDQARKEQAGNPMAGAMGLAAIVNGIKAEAAGDEVRVALDLTQAQVDQLKAMAMMMIGMAAAQQQAAPAAPPPAPAKK